MRVIVAGSRDITDQALIDQAIDQSGFPVAEIVSGGCSGADSCGEAWAAKNFIRVKRFPADWARYGRGAGPIRNGEMARYADALIAVPMGRSAGTRDMIRKAREAGLLVFVREVSDT